MTTYEVIDPQAGDFWQGGLDDLSRHLKVNALLCSVDKDGARTNLGFILHRDIVLFALQWAKSVNEDRKAEVLKCFELTEQWLEDEDSVTKEELDSAARAAYAYAARADARSGSRAAHAARSAAYATYAAAYAAIAADRSAAAARSADAYTADAYTAQGQMIVDYYASLRAK